MSSLRTYSRSLFFVASLKTQNRAMWTSKGSNSFSKRLSSVEMVAQIGFDVGFNDHHKFHFAVLYPNSVKSSISGFNFHGILANLTQQVMQAHLCKFVVETFEEALQLLLTVRALA